MQRLLVTIWATVACYEQATGAALAASPAMRYSETSTATQFPSGTTSSQPASNTKIIEADAAGVPARQAMLSWIASAADDSAGKGDVAARGLSSKQHKHQRDNINNLLSDVDNGDKSRPSSTIQVLLGSKTITMPIPADASLYGNTSPPQISTGPDNPLGTTPEASPSTVAIPIGATLSDGGAPLVIGTHTLSIATAGFVNLDGTLTAPPTAKPTANSINDPNAAGAAIEEVASSLNLGSSFVVADHTISQGPNGGYAVDNTITFASAPALASALVVDAAVPASVARGLQSLSAGDAITIGTHTITRGADGYTDGSLTYSDASGVASGLVAAAATQTTDTATSTDADYGAAVSGLSPGQATTVNGHTFSENMLSSYIVDGTATYGAASQVASAFGVASTDAGNFGQKTGGLVNAATTGTAQVVTLGGQGGPLATPVADVGRREQMGWGLVVGMGGVVVAVVG